MKGMQSCRESKLSLLSYSLIKKFNLIILGIAPMINTSRKWAESWYVWGFKTVDTLSYSKVGRASSFVYLSRFSLRNAVKGKTGSKNEWTGEVLNAEKSFTLWYLVSGSSRKCSDCHLVTPLQWIDIFYCQCPGSGGKKPLVSFRKSNIFVTCQCPWQAIGQPVS